ncbi:DUF3134 domain-containing protein [Microcoleus sp. FACHB-68]|uniref:DUF3134 domain-containing protein n=1 Tax=Microcoleus sp. FACHB-68 TaxID=2692826 RepID=UPI001689D140|nr:DUF3134 domain-containing protein [Microcoleus sp. FACHB-68]MBD1939420.1 DUF3134 domain-containing protein [Microcoleus sp. FACHB-68]
MYNPSLRQESRHEPADVIPLNQETSLLDWLENTGRLIARDSHELAGYLDEEEEISELMAVDEGTFDLDDDDDDELDLEE